MKRILVFFIAVFSLLAVQAQDSFLNTKIPTDTEYCAVYKKGEIIMLLNGKPMNKEIALANGTRVSINGTIIRKDGTNRVLKNGECIDRNDVINDRAKSSGHLWQSPEIKNTSTR